MRVTRSGGTSARAGAVADDLRVLTVRQPWAWAIIHGGKDVENRTRNIAGAWRGLVAIHAGLHPYEQDNASSRAHRAARGTKVDTRIVFGAVIGVVDLTHVHPDCTEIVMGYGETPVCSAWAMSDNWHLCFANPRPLAQPIPAKGRLGLWRPDEELRAAILDQVGAVA